MRGVPADDAAVRRELQELIELTKATLAQQEAAASISKADVSRKANGAAVQTKHFAAGDDCLAKYSGDGQWYPARITAVGGGESNRVFSIVFRGYNTTELLKAHEIKSLPASYQASSSSSSAAAICALGYGEGRRITAG